MTNYGFGDNQVKKTQNPFPIAQCVEDVEITEAKYSLASDETWESIDISYTRAGTTIVDKMFAINEGKISPRPWIPGDTVEDSAANAVRIYNTHLLHIATKLGLTKKDLETCSTKSFYSLAQDYCKLINSNCKGHKLYAKTVPNNKGFPKISRNSGNTVPFLQNMNEGECTLKYTDKEENTVIANSQPENGVTKTKTVSDQWVNKSV